MHLGNLVPCHVRHLSAPECANCLTREEFHTLMKTLADLVAAQALTAQAVTDAAARVVAAIAAVPAAEDLTSAVDAESALQAQLAGIAPAPAPVS